MPLKVTKNFIHVPSGAPDSGFQKGFGRTVVIDKSRGIKGTLRKLKNGKTRISSYLFPTKNFTKAQAQAWVKKHKEEAQEMEHVEDVVTKKAGIKEEFLDQKNRRWPLTYPQIFETLIAFNSGDLFEDYGYDGMGIYGRKLARRLSQYSYTSMNDCEYDEDGNPISERGTHENKDFTMYKYHDGQIITVKSSNSGDNETEWEYSEEDDEEEVDSISEEEIFEARYSHMGGVVRALRRKKKKSRSELASEMNMSASRLKEIEDDGDADETEIGEIASALKITKKKLKGIIGLSVDMPPDSSQISGREEIEIEDIEIEEIELPESTIKVYESIQEINRNNKIVKAHRLGGEILVESKLEDGTIKFTVPMIKVDALTANGNRYSLKCCENVIKDIEVLQESHARRDGEAGEKLSILHINSPKAEKEKPPTPTMLPTHGARISEEFGNPLLSIAGVVTGAHLNEDKSILFIEGETLPTTAGKDMTVLLDRKLVKGVSLAATPAKGMYEKNDKGGFNVDRIHFLGSDFTNNPAMPFEADEAGFKLAA